MEKLSSMRLVSSLLLVLMLLMTIEMSHNPMVAEARKAGTKMGPNPIVAGVGKARTCKSLSQKFKGLCFIGNNCANICKSEGFYGGVCTGFRRRCFCTGQC